MMAFPTDNSAAELSYMLNNSIEKERDLSATILNLVAKDCIKIEQKGEEFQIVDLKYNTEELTEDEKYIYDWITSDDKSKYSYEVWKKIIVDKMKKDYTFIESDFNPGKLLFGIVVPMFIIVFVIGATGLGDKVPNLNMISFLTLGITFASLMIFVIVWGTNPNNKKMYSEKAAKTVKQWDGFKKYLKVYSNIKEAEIASIVIWEKYLAYAMVLGVNLNYNKLKLEDIPTVKFLNKISIKERLRDFMDKTY